MMGSGSQITPEVYRRVRPILLAKARAFGLKQDDLEDLVQETFLHAQRALDRGQFQGESALDTWIIGIGKHCCLKLRRAKRAAMRSASEVAIDDPTAAVHEKLRSAAEPGPEKTAEDRQLLSRVVQSIRELPEKLRGPLILIAQGREYKDAAAELDISTDLVTSRVHQARAKLRQKHARTRKPSRG